MSSKKVKTEPVWSIDLWRKEYDGPGPNPSLNLFEIHEFKNRFLVKYYGVCDVCNASTFQEAKDYVYSHI